VASRSDPAYTTLERLITDFPRFDSKIFVEEDDPNLSGDGGQENNLGPNPKIRNMSRGYREAKGDILWVIDCNVWIGKGVTGRMVDKLCGFAPGGRRVMPYKLVHQIPLVVDSVGASKGEEARGLLTDESNEGGSEHLPVSGGSKGLLSWGGGRLEEIFMACSHAKFYTAINTVAVAPCIVGKSNMFRRSHLDSLTSASPSPYAPGIDFFSNNICEDHLIGDLLWRNPVPEQIKGEKWRNHGLVFGDVAIQPMASTSVSDYIARRVRWLRVRKWTVILATLVEPGVESILCSAYGAFALTTLPQLQAALGLPRSWTAFFMVWLTCVIIWMGIDRLTYNKLHSVASVELDEDTPSFARPPQGSRRRFGEWAAAWLGREVLALPIWIFAVLGGTTVKWRNKTFWVGMDMKVYKYDGEESIDEAAHDGVDGKVKSTGKARSD
jgi:ceramide glucosyltransferase